MLWGKARGAITAYRECEVVPLVILIAELAEVALDSIAQVVARDVTTDDPIVELGDPPEDNLLLGRVVGILHIPRSLMSHKGVEGMLVESMIPREDLIERPAEAIGVRIVYTPDIGTITIVGVL